jgi:uncharacterized protein YjeT (DUF2065 family)
VGGDLAAALCLVLVLEGLALFAAPDAWKRAAEQMQRIDRRTMRTIGAGMVIAGLVALKIVH